MDQAIFNSKQYYYKEPAMPALLFTMEYKKDAKVYSAYPVCWRELVIRVEKYRQYSL